MKAIDIIAGLRRELAALKAQGQTAVAVAGLEAYLTAIEPEARKDGDATGTEKALEKAGQDLEFEVWKVRAPMQHASSLEMFKSVIEAGLTALKNVMLINGGASVALLAFL